MADLAALLDRHGRSGSGLPRPGGRQVRSRLAGRRDDGADRRWVRSRDEPTRSAQVVDELVAAVEPGLVATTGPRYFGFVIGGRAPGRHGGGHAHHRLGPAGVQRGDLAGRRRRRGGGRRLARPSCSGCRPACRSGSSPAARRRTPSALAAARHRVLADAGWDVERDGLPRRAAGARRGLGGAARHIDRALRLLGLGTGAVTASTPTRRGASTSPRSARRSRAAGRTDDRVPAGRQRQHRRLRRPARRDRGCAPSAAPGCTSTAPSGCGPRPARRTRHLVDGAEGADSWATDGHKWLNVPYDSGYVFCADPAAHRAAMSYTAAYLTGAAERGCARPATTCPSRRGGHAASRPGRRCASSGRSGVAELVERCCALARRFARPARRAAGQVLNDVVLNQVLVRFGDDDAAPTRSCRRPALGRGAGWARRPGTGRRAMRISVSSATTTEDDVDRALLAVSTAWTAVARR